MSLACSFRNVCRLLLVSALINSAAAAEVLCTALANGESGRVLVQEGACEQRLTPASTFKIALSLMGYDSGILVTEHSPTLPFREGDPDWIESWKAPTDPEAWMRNSVVWFSWRITQSLDHERFKRYVKAFGYGNQDVSGNPGQNDGLTHAWLTSSLKISPLEQLAFLRKLVRRELPVSLHAYDMTERITLIERLPGGWEVHGKTGTGSRVSPDGSIDRSRQIGWFVGWARKANKSLVFAYCIEDEARQPPDHAGPRAKTTFLSRLPSLLP